MSGYLIGNVIGRLIASYLIVWVAGLFASRFDWRGAFRKTHGVWGIASVVIIFLLGLLGSQLN
jgi:hypothetical protein